MKTKHHLSPFFSPSYPGYDPNGQTDDLCLLKLVETVPNKPVVVNFVTDSRTQAQVRTCVRGCVLLLALYFACLEPSLASE